MVVGAEAMNGGLWCSPVANTSSPTSSAFFAISTVALIRSCSDGVRPVVGSGVTSPTVKIPNCMTRSSKNDSRCNYLNSSSPGDIPASAVDSWAYLASASISRMWSG